MCDLCDSLKQKADSAHACGDSQRERVMTVILINHKRNEHGIDTRLVVVAPESVTWPDGVTWVVKADK